MINWVEGDLRGARVEALEGWRGIVVLGQKANGRAFCASVRLTGEIKDLSPDWEGSVTSVMPDDIGDIFMTGGTPPRTYPDEDNRARWDPPDADDPFVRGWGVMGNEDPCKVAVSRSGRVHAFDEEDEVPCEGPRLASAGASDRLLVGGADSGVVVVGDLVPEPDSAGAQIWRYGPGVGWDSVSTARPVDGFTDIYTRTAPVIAGHADGLPCLFTEGGESLPAPQVVLDPSYPMVRIALVEGRYKIERLALVVQAREGIQLWLQHDRGWTMLPGPAGRLAAARFNTPRRHHAWVATEGRIWYGNLSVVWDALIP